MIENRVAAQVDEAQASEVRSSAGGRRPPGTLGTSVRSICNDRPHHYRERIFQVGVLVCDSRVGLQLIGQPSTPGRALVWRRLARQAVPSEEGRVQQEEPNNNQGGAKDQTSPVVRVRP